MATSIGVGDIMACRAWLQASEQGAVNTYNYECIAKTGTGCTDQQLANDYDLNIGPFYKTLVTSQVEYRGVQVYFLKRFAGGALPAASVSIVHAGVGTATGNTLPRNTSPILKYSTLARGPSGRGRLYLPFVASEYLDTTGNPTNAFDVFVNSQASNLLNTFAVGTGPNTSTFAWVLLTKHLGGPPTIRGQIIAAQSAGKFGQMHKRGDYGKANSSPI